MDKNNDILKTILCKEGYLIKKKNNKKLINKIKSELTVSPFITFNKNITPVPFMVYQENDKYLSIPKYYGLKKLGNPIKNLELKGQTVNIEFMGELREKQMNIFNIIIERFKTVDGGLLSLGCGEGKTILALYLACYLKIKTLVIVHKSFLLNQWVKKVTEFTNAKIGIIQQNKIDIDNKEIVIGMLQSIAKDKYDSDIFIDFGLVIFDEAHHAPSKYFSKALPIIACKRTLALSATPERADKLEKVLYWYFGDILYKSPIETINTVLVKIMKYNIKDDKFKEYTLNYGKEINRPKTINKLIEINKRNIFIFNLLKEVLLEEGRKIIILSDRIEHLNVLKEMCDVNLENITNGYYIGGLKQSVLDESEKAQIIFATYAMASEALDIPELNTLFMITPRKEIEQAVGRITRKKDHTVQPLIIDIVDQLPSFARQGLYRRKFYIKKEFIIKLYEVEENVIINEIPFNQKKNENIVINTNDINFVD